MLDLPDYLERHKPRVIQRWKELVVERLDINLEGSALVNDIGEFIDELIEFLRSPAERRFVSEGAQRHGTQRLRVGVDIGALTVETGLIAEALTELAEADGRQLSCEDVRLLIRGVSQGAAASVSSYAAMRDKELAEEAYRHFSFVAHELRTPIQTSQMAATLLESDSSSTQDMALERLQRSLSHLSELVDSALVEIRLSGEPEMHVQPLRVLDLLREASEEIIYHAEPRGISLTMDAGDFQVQGDHKLLVSAIINLLKNAVKFTKQKGRVSLRASKRDGRALFEVEDQCGGMPEGLPERLFQPFVQGDRDKSGFGLGLMIVKQAAEAHGGEVRIRNQAGHGCTFVVDIPLRQER